MHINPNSKQKVTALNGQRLDNSGSVTFNIKYQGNTTEVEALVFTSIEDEVLLSWKVLQDLGVMNGSFPNGDGSIKAAAVTITTNLTNVRNEEDAKSTLGQLIREGIQQSFQHQKPHAYNEELVEPAKGQKVV